VLGIFDVVDENGVPLSAYGLNVDQGGTLDVISKIIAFLIGLGFSVIKVVIGFACWLVDWALGFGLAKALLNPVSDIAGTIRAQVIDNLGLPGLFLMIVALWGGYHILFKRRSKGWSEIAMSLVIASIAGVTLADPGRVLIGNADDSGVLGTTKQFSMHIADVVLDDMCKTSGSSAGRGTQEEGGSLDHLHRRGEENLGGASGEPADHRRSGRCLRPASGLGSLHGQAH
jgi:hypothetical protein